MATKIVTKNSSTASAVPTASDLVQGELAVNVADKRLFTEDNGGSIVELGTNPSTIDINAGSIDGTAIGASSASTGAFTTLTATGAFTSRGIDDNADATAITIDSSENVGIGTSSPSAVLTTETTGALTLDSNDGDHSAFGLLVYLPDSRANTVSGAIGFSGNGGRKYAAIGAQTYADTDQTGLNFYVQSNASGSSAQLSEAMRIDSSGNVLVGKTAASFGTAGVAVFGGGEIDITNTNEAPLFLNRLGSDGVIQYFYKDGAVVGSIGNYGGLALDVGKGTTAVLRFRDSLNAIYPAAGIAGGTSDGVTSLGISSGRFNDIYATNGTIQTSDRNEKQDIAELSDAEQRVAVACKGLLRKFRWKDSVAEKGAEARTHFGIIAQDLQAAFAAEGLDAGDYAMFISTTWTDEETNEEKTRMGVRYSELLAFIISAI